MLQDFTVTTDPSVGPRNLRELRRVLDEDNLQGYIVPRADAHQGEIVAARDERLAWLTGFTGSAGTAIVLADKSAVFVDGRYILQVAEQVDSSAFELLHSGNVKPVDWLAKNVHKGDRIGYDPMLLTANEVAEYRKFCVSGQAELEPVAENPIDRLWIDQPEPPLAPVSIRAQGLAGESTQDKISRIKEEIGKKSAHAAILTLPDSIAWLFNIRGGDLPHTPVALSFAVVPVEGPCTIFIDSRKITGDAQKALKGLVEFQEPDGLITAVKERAGRGESILLDPGSAPEMFGREIEAAGGNVVKERDPVILPKAIKNNVEQEGMRAAHVRDGIAYARFLEWFDSNSPTGDLDEIGAAKMLEKFRAESGELKDLSFDTISSVGPNGAINHYRVNENSNLRIEPGSLYLTDSGAQYEDGTTDITRTIAVGEVNSEHRNRFTLVLKGNIAISTARFPEGATGAQLDSLARVDLWHSGFDFDHGTGHGVGVYLSVHEGPQRISKLGFEPLKPGMILSNEPGYYKAGEYGIRIENLELVKKPESIPGGDRKMMGFETLTLAPIDRRLIDSGNLTEQELNWLNSYHSRVFEKLSPNLDSKTVDWLEKACSPL